LPQGPTWSSEDECPTEMYTTSGECCKACNVGEGMVQPCGVNQTICEPCLDSFRSSRAGSSLSWELLEKGCSHSWGEKPQAAGCSMELGDTSPSGPEGGGKQRKGKTVKRETVCKVGFGLMFPCQESQNTVCEECPEGTFSSEANFVDPCLPCTTCEENEVLVKECTPTSDAECR
ncbi:Tumor necrosis factor receptor superfamily member 16, partial [Apaloderma vittatum]